MRYTKEELIEMGNNAAEKTTVEFFKKVWVLIGVAAGLLAIAKGFSIVLPDMTNLISKVAIAANVVATTRTLPPAYVAFAANDVFREGLKKFKKGEMTAEHFYEHYLSGVVQVLETTVEALETEVKEKKGKSM